MNDLAAVFKGMAGAVLAIAVLSALGLCAGLISFDVRNPILSCTVIAVAYISLLVWAFRSIRRPHAPFMSGLLIGCMIGGLGSGLCAFAVAVGSRNGLNMH